MKNYFIATAFFVCLGFAATAQNQCRIKIPFGVNACGLTSLVYANNDKQNLGSLCKGDHVFDTDKNKTAYIIFNGTACYPQTITKVELDKITVMVKQVTGADGPTYIIDVAK